MKQTKKNTLPYIKFVFKLCCYILLKPKKGCKKKSLNILSLAADLLKPGSIPSMLLIGLPHLALQWTCLDQHKPIKPSSSLGFSSFFFFSSLRRYFFLQKCCHESPKT